MTDKNNALTGAVKEINKIRTDLLERMFTIKLESPSGKREVQQATDEARLLGLLAIEAIDKFEFSVETHRIVCICKEDIP